VITVPHDGFLALRWGQLQQRVTACYIQDNFLRM
jgi:hypothetical protein